jgi:hypothetical protein
MLCSASGNTNRFHAWRPTKGFDTFCPPDFISTIHLEQSKQAQFGSIFRLSGLPKSKQGELWFGGKEPSGVYRFNGNSFERKY